MNLDEYVNICPACNEYLSREDKLKGCCFNCSAEFSPKQREYALKDPKTYLSDIALSDGSSKKVIELADGRVDGKIIAVYDVFAVTECGIECLSHYYAIDKRRLLENDWIEHMSEKTWVNISAFKAALEHAKKIHNCS